MNCNAVARARARRGADFCEFCKCHSLGNAGGGLGYNLPHSQHLSQIDSFARTTTAYAPETIIFYTARHRTKEYLIKTAMERVNLLPFSNSRGFEGRRL